MDQGFKIKLLKKDIKGLFQKIEDQELDEDEKEELLHFLSCSVESIKSSR